LQRGAKPEVAIVPPKANVHRGHCDAQLDAFSFSSLPHINLQLSNHLAGRKRYEKRNELGLHNLIFLIKNNNLSADDTVVFHVIHQFIEILQSPLRNMAKDLVLKAKINALLNLRLSGGQSSNQSTAPLAYLRKREGILFAVDDDIIGCDREGSARETNCDDAPVAAGDFKGGHIGGGSGARDETDVHAVGPRDSVDFLLHVLDGLGVECGGRADALSEFNLFFIDIEAKSLVAHRIRILNRHMSFC